MARALARLGLAPPAGTIDTLAIVAVGYLEMQQGRPNQLSPAIASSRAAASLAGIHRQGIRPTPPAKVAHSERFREIVDAALARRRMAWVGDQARSTLAAIALGAWDENDVPGKRQPIGDYFVALFSNGLG